MNCAPASNVAGRLAVPSVVAIRGEPGATPEFSTLALHLRPLQPWLSDVSLTEICINRPGVGFMESQAGWSEVLLPFATFDWCLRLAKLVANFTRQRVDEESPLLSAALPGGERIQIVLPPATPRQCVAITIRRPSDRVWSLSELAAKGLFEPTERARPVLDPIESELNALLEARRYEAFLSLAVRSRKNIVISGPTGSGKTTCIKALIGEIPAGERLITIEDTPELVLGGHPNHVRLFFSKDDQGLARVGPKQLLEACLRMRPDRILLAELRAEEAFDYLRNANSGHPGSITSVHAASAELAFEQLMLLVKQSRAGAELARSDIKSLLYSLIDVVVQFRVDEHRRGIREIWYEPERKRGSQAAAR